MMKRTAVGLLWTTQLVFIFSTLCRVAYSDLNVQATRAVLEVGPVSLIESRNQMRRDVERTFPNWRG
jgi:hypothetical protein